MNDRRILARRRRRLRSPRTYDLLDVIIVAALLAPLLAILMLIPIVGIGALVEVIAEAVR